MADEILFKTLENYDKAFIKKLQTKPLSCNQTWYNPDILFTSEIKDFALSWIDFVCFYLFSLWFKSFLYYQTSIDIIDMFWVNKTSFFLIIISFIQVKKKNYPV